MDVNSTLAELRAELRADSPDVDRIAQLFEAMDGWLTRGGFLPSDWAAGR
jgi:hypothetical protein